MKMNSYTPYIANLVNSIIGVSVLAMPFCMKKCGLILGLVMLLSSCWLTYITCSMLLSSAVIKRRRTYEYLAAATIGPTGKLAVELSMIGLMLGTCVAFYVIIGDLATEIVSSFVDVDHAMLRTYVIVFTGLCIALPLGLMKSLAALGFIGYFSLIFYFIFVCVMFKVSASHGLLGFEWTNNIKFFEPSGVFQCLPIFSLAFACHCQLFVVYDSLDDPSIPKMDYIVKSSLKIVTSVYSLVAIFGYTTFADSVEGNVLRNFPSTTLLEFIKMGFATSVVVGFPLMIFPCRQSIHTLFFKQQTYSDGLVPKTYIEPFTFKTLTLGIVFTTMTVAILIPNVETILGLTGATMGSLICFILPAVIFLKADYSKSHRIPKMVFGIGCILFVVCTYSNVFPTVEEPPPQVAIKPVEDVIKIPTKPLIKEPNVEPAHRHEPPNPQPPPVVNQGVEVPLKPEVAVVKAGVPIAKPEIPIAKPEIPAAKPEIPKVIEEKPKLDVKPMGHPEPEKPVKPVDEASNKNKAAKKNVVIESPIKNKEEIDPSIKRSNEEAGLQPIKAKAKETINNGEKLAPTVVVKSADLEKVKEDQVKLLKKIKESNEVQSKLLEKQRELLKVLESQQDANSDVVSKVKDTEKGDKDQQDSLDSLKVSVIDKQIKANVVEKEAVGANQDSSQKVKNQNPTLLKPINQEKNDDRELVKPVQQMKPNQQEEQKEQIPQSNNHQDVVKNEVKRQENQKEEKKEVNNAIEVEPKSKIQSDENLPPLNMDGLKKPEVRDLKSVG